MAVFNEIQVGRYNRLLQKLLSMKGEPPARSLGGEILVTLPLFHGVENRYLEAWDRFGVFLDVGPVVGQRPGFRIRNPAASNVVAVLEAVTLAPVTFADFFLANIVTTPTANLATVVVAQRMDGRGRASSTLIVSQTTIIGAPLQNFWGGVVPLNTVLEMVKTVNQEIPLLPGDTLDIGATAGNSRAIAGLFWRERFLEDSERA